MDRREVIVGTVAAATVTILPAITTADVPRYSGIVEVQTFFPEATVRKIANFELRVGKRNLLSWAQSTLGHVHWIAPPQSNYSFVVQPGEVIHPKLFVPGEQGTTIIDLVHFGPEGRTEQRLWFGL